MTIDQSHFTYLMFAGTLWAPICLIIIGIMLKGCKNQTDADERNKKLSPFKPFFAKFIFQLFFTFHYLRPAALVRYRLDSYHGIEEVAKLMHVMATYHST